MGRFTRSARSSSTSGASSDAISESSATWRASTPARASSSSVNVGGWSGVGSSSRFSSHSRTVTGYNGTAGIDARADPTPATYQEASVRVTISGHRDRLRKAGQGGEGGRLNPVFSTGVGPRRGSCGGLPSRQWIGCPSPATPSPGPSSPYGVHYYRSAVLEGHAAEVAMQRAGNPSSRPPGAWNSTPRARSQIGRRRRPPHGRCAQAEPCGLPRSVGTYDKRSEANRRRSRDTPSGTGSNPTRLGRHPHSRVNPPRQGGHRRSSAPFEGLGIWTASIVPSKQH